MIQYIAEDVRMPAIQKRQINSWIRETAAKYNKFTGEIAYIFCSDEYLLKINIKYLNHDYYTDIITFDYGHDTLISGDIFISTETVRSNAEKFETTFEDELRRVMIHGILHLCGFDDETPELRKQMQSMENEALDSLK